MRAKREAQHTVQELRRQGLSYRDIMRQVPVSKSSVSLWCRNIELDDTKRQALLARKVTAGQQGLAIIAARRKNGTLKRSPSERNRVRCPSSCDRDQATIERVRWLYEGHRFGVREVAAQLGVSFWRVYDLMRQHSIPRRKGSEQNFATYKYKPQSPPKQALTQEEERLRVAGTMLYWAEGAKTGHIVDFANSDPQLIGLFVTFLRRICGVAESRLRVLLYMYANQDMGRLKSFWSELTGIPLQQFVKPYVREMTPNVSRRNMPWGLGLISKPYETPQRQGSSLPAPRSAAAQAGDLCGVIGGFETSSSAYSIC